MGTPKGKINNPKGRPKGMPNKKNKLIKDMIIGALDKLGGEKYLQEQAIKHPGAFMTLVGKTLPMQVTGDGGGPVYTEMIYRVEIGKSGTKKP